MKTELIEILGLPTDSTEEQIISQVRANAQTLVENKTVSDREKLIRKKMAESCWAMSREVAEECLRLNGEIS